MWRILDCVSCRRVGLKSTSPLNNSFFSAGFELQSRCSLPCMAQPWSLLNPRFNDFWYCKLPWRPLGSVGQKKTTNHSPAVSPSSWTVPSVDCILVILKCCLSTSLCFILDYFFVASQCHTPERETCTLMLQSSHAAALVCLVHSHEYSSREGHKYSTRTS